MGKAQLQDQPRLVPLGWETEHFGFSVARLDARDLDDDAVQSELEQARQTGTRLVVVTCPNERELPTGMLARFNGSLTDQKVTFVRTLAGESPAAETDTIAEYEAAQPTSELIDLAIASGVYSRFNVDARFPRHLFLDMYRIWIERSVRREIADAVLIDRDPACPGGMAGFVTVNCAAGVGKIGLIAVAEAARGRGVGRRLIAASHRWMRAQNAAEARVVTQLTNNPACALYQRSGYAIASIEKFYHFWPLTGAGET